MAVIAENYLDLLQQKKAFANLATIMVDGSPQVTPVWFDYTDGVIRVNTAKGRVKSRTLRPGAAVGVVALGQCKISGGKLLGGDRPDVDPEPLEQRHSIIRKQVSPCPQSEGAFHRDLAKTLRLTKSTAPTLRAAQPPWNYKKIKVYASTIFRLRGSYPARPIAWDRDSKK